MLKKSLFAAFIVGFLCFHSAFSQSLINGTVIDVVDGRTLVVETVAQKKVNVRLRYLEVPEPEQPLADVVKHHLKELALGKRISVKNVRITEKKVVGLVTIEEKSRNFDLAGQMLRDGAGWFDIYDADSNLGNITASYQELELAAKTEKRGVWGIPDMKTPWEFRNRKIEAVASLNITGKDSKSVKPVETGLVSSIKNSGNGRVDNRRLPIYDFDFGTAEKNISSGGRRENNIMPGSVSSNLTQFYNGVLNRGSVLTNPLELNFKNGNSTKKVIALFGYDFSVEQSGGKNLKKLGLLILTEFKTKPFLQGKNVSLILDENKKVNLGKPRYKKTTRFEGMMFETDREEILSILSSKSLTLAIGKSKVSVNESFKQVIDDFVNTIK